MTDSIFLTPRSGAQHRFDTHAGIARFGGAFHHVNYTSSYILAARTLYLSAKDSAKLDEMCLPILFLQRHALELAIKDYVSSYSDLILLEFTGNPALCTRATKAQETASTTHHLSKLHGLAAQLGRLLDLPDLPADLAALVSLVEDLEGAAPDASRYSTVRGPRHDPLRATWPTNDVSEDLYVFNYEPTVSLPLGLIDSHLAALSFHLSMSNYDAVLYQVCKRIHDLVCEQE